MSDRVLGLTLQLKNAETVSQLESVIKDINTELKQLPVNSEGFETMSTLAKKAGTQIKNINEELRTFSDEKQLRSISRIGESITSGLSLATVASSAFGDQSKEAIGKAIETATQLTVVLVSLRPLMEGLTATNRAAFKQFIQGFADSEIAAKLFGTASKTALSLTGIGLAIVALTLLYENWSKITDAIGLTNTTQEKTFTAQQDNIDKAKEKLAELNHTTQNQIDLLTAQGKKDEEIFAIKKNNITLQINLQKQQLDLDNKRLKAAEDDLNTAAKRTGQFAQYAFILDIFGKGLGSAAQKVGDLNKQVKENKQTIEDLDNSLKIIAANQDTYHKKEAKDAEDREKKLEEARHKGYEDAQEILEKRYKDSQEAEKNIAQLKIDAIGNEQQKELAQLDFNIKEQESKLIGSDQQIAEQRKLIEQNRVDQLLGIELKFIKEKQKLEDEATKKQDEKDKKERDEAEKKNKEEIKKYQEFAKLGVDNLAKVSEAINKTISANIAGVSSQIEIQNNAYQQSTAKIATLSAELSSTQGAAHTQVLAQISQEQTAQTNAQNARAQLEKKKVDYQNKQNTIQWETSLIKAIVDTALGVSNALSSGVPPESFVMAAITGALGAVEIGTIAGNKPKTIPAPSFAHGGFTKAKGDRDSTGFRVAGVVHENEYVVPQHVLFSNMGSQLVNTLEGMRKGSFASGGFSTKVPSINSSKINSITSTDLLHIVRNLPAQQVSVVEVTQGQSKVNVLQTRASI